MLRVTKAHMQISDMQRDFFHYHILIKIVCSDNFYVINIVNVIVNYFSKKERFSQSIVIIIISLMQRQENAANSM